MSTTKLPLELVKLASQAGAANICWCNGDDRLGQTEQNRTTEQLNQNMKFWENRFNTIDEKIQVICDSIGIRFEYNGIWPTFFDKEGRIISYE